MATQPKTYDLKEAETQTITILHRNQQAAFSAVLSLIASERLGYKITDRTQFRLNEDLSTIEISELEDEVPVVKDDKPKSAAVTSK